MSGAKKAALAGGPRLSLGLGKGGRMTSSSFLIFYAVYFSFEKQHSHRHSPPRSPPRRRPVAVERQHAARRASLPHSVTERKPPCGGSGAAGAEEEAGAQLGIFCILQGASMSVAIVNCTLPHLIAFPHIPTYSLPHIFLAFPLHSHIFPHVEFPHIPTYSHIFPHIAFPHIQYVAFMQR